MNLFEVFSIYFSGSFPDTKIGHKHLLVCMEHLTRWLIVVPARYVTAEVVRNFISAEFIHPFGVP